MASWRECPAAARLAARGDEVTCENVVSQDRRENCVSSVTQKYCAGWQWSNGETVLRRRRGVGGSDAQASWNPALDGGGQVAGEASAVFFLKPLKLFIAPYPHEVGSGSPIPLYVGIVGFLYQRQNGAVNFHCVRHVLY